MGAILMRAACFILIIILGHVLRRIGFFKKDDFYVLSKTVLKITLPAAIISNMNGMKIEPSLLGLCLLGFGGGVLYMTVLYLLNLRSFPGKSGRLRSLIVPVITSAPLRCHLYRAFLARR